jgi:NADH-ubiquinone oxidoreductase chain 4
VLLKLGGYGILRVRRIFNIDYLITQLLRISLLGGGLLSVLCLTQRDIKVVIAYSSVVHIALVIAGVLFLSNWGLEGSVIIIVAHGVCSSGIFAAANLIYERRHSRRFYFNRGNLNNMPAFSLIWFTLIVANFGGPFTFNLLGEILLIVNIASISNFTLVVLCALSFFSAAYRIILYSSTNQGQLKSFVGFIRPIKPQEIIILYSHV